MIKYNFHRYYGSCNVSTSCENLTNLNEFFVFKSQLSQLGNFLTIYIQSP
jgi:hypothetical protein